MANGTAVSGMRSSRFVLDRILGLEVGWMGMWGATGSVEPVTRVSRAPLSGGAREGLGGRVFSFCGRLRDRFGGSYIERVRRG